jgi:hypothetical protein
VDIAIAMILKNRDASDDAANMIDNANESRQCLCKPIRANTPTIHVSQTDALLPPREELVQPLEQQFFS